MKPGPGGVGCLRRSKYRRWERSPFWGVYTYTYTPCIYIYINIVHIDVNILYCKDVSGTSEDLGIGIMEHLNYISLNCLTSWNFCPGRQFESCNFALELIFVQTVLHTSSNGEYSSCRMVLRQIEESPDSHPVLSSLQAVITCQPDPHLSTKPFQSLFFFSSGSLGTKSLNGGV